MNQLPKPKYRVYSPLVLLDLEQEKIMRSLQPPSEICPEENEVRVANRRYSDVLPLRATSGVSVRNRPQYKDVTDNDDRTSPRIVSAPLPHKVNDYPSNTIVIAPLRSPNKQDTFDPVDHYIIHPSRNIHPSISGIFLSNKRQNPYIGTPIGDAHFGMPAHIPPHHPKLHPYHSLASHPPGFASTVPSYLPREDSGSSLLSLEGRDTSIRIVKPNLTLSPPNKTKLKDNKENASVHSTSGQPETNQQTIM
ncbi:hypothetical protein F5Y07DRAFT_65458 [Xylaria sp. FL0933]|nr:hypothetical protein F5Y07DRAFT_65458 [Xylaria sp. FL0933]